MEKQKEVDEFVHKFECKKCKNLLGGIKNNSMIIFYCGTSRQQNDTGITGAFCNCGEENKFNIKNTLKKLFDKNLKSVLESSAKKQEKNKSILKCKKCKKLLAIHKNSEWVVKNIKGIVTLKDNGQKEIECICGEETQIGT